MKKIFARVWFAVGGLMLRLVDTVSGTVFVTFSDCAQDADGRQAIRAQMQYDGAAGDVEGVKTTAELAHVMLRALQRAMFNGRRVVFHGNLAPRVREQSNGADFCVARVGKSWVIATEGGYTWSLLRLFGLVRQVYRLSWEKCIDYLFERGVIDRNRHQELRDTQFRSLYLSWLFRFYRLGFKFPGELVGVEQISIDLKECWEKDGQLVIGYRDGFNNTYLLATVEMIEAEIGDIRSITDEFFQAQRAVEFVRRLKDVPKDQLCLVEVSAGYNGTPLLGLEAKSHPNAAGSWPDPLPGWYSEQKAFLALMATTGETQQFQNCQLPHASVKEAQSCLDGKGE